MEERKMLALSDPITINGMKLKNRMVRAATLEMMATPDGGATEDHVRLYENLAQGGVGLIITGATYINEGTRLDPSQNGIHQDSLIPKWQKVTEAVHRNGGKIGMQIVHFGRIMDPKANVTGDQKHLHRFHVFLS